MPLIRSHASPRRDPYRENAGRVRRSVAAVAVLAGLLAGCGSPTVQEQCADLDARAIEAAERYDTAVTQVETDEAKAEWNGLVGELIALDC